jgi:hypothetical protein
MTHEIGIFDATTGEQIVREMNAEELAAHEQSLAENEALLEAQAAAEAAKATAQAKLAALGLTTDDLQALGL